MNISEYIDSISSSLANIYNHFESKSKISSKSDYISIEYFSLLIFNSLFNSNFQNLNESEFNSKYIDLIDKKRKIGIQVTLEKPNSKKVEKSEKAFSSYDIDKLIVFFFKNTSPRIKGSSTKVEIWTLKTVINHLNSHHSCVVDLYDKLEYWSDPKALLPDSFIAKLNTITKKKVTELSNLKKFNFKLYIDDIDDTIKVRYFCAPEFSKINALNIYKMFKNSPYIDFLINHDNTKKLKNLFSSFDKISYLDINYFEERKNEILRKYSESKENKIKQDFFQFDYRSTRDLLGEMLFSLKASRSSFLPILRPAGQGKTFFVCKKVLELIDDGVPTILISPSLSKELPRDVFSKRIKNLFCNDNYLMDLKVLLNFLKTKNKSLVVVVDAINEYGNMFSCVDSIGEMLDDVQLQDFSVKLLITSRSQKYEEVKDKFLSKFGESSYIEIDNIFYDNYQILVNYLKHYKVLFNENHLFRDLTKQNRLFIDKFCSTFSNSSLLTFHKLDYVKVLDTYFYNKAKAEVKENVLVDEEEFFDTINCVIGKMVEFNDFNEVKLSSFSLEIRQNIRKLADKEIFSISEKDNKNYVSFVFEYYRDFFLSDFFLTKCNDEIDSFVFKKNNYLDGFLEMLFLRHRKDEKINKENDYRSKWYLTTAATKLHILPYDDLDECDERNILRILDKFKMPLDDRKISLLQSILINFIKPYRKGDGVFKINKLFSLNNNAFTCFAELFNKSKYIIKNYIQQISIENFDSEYIQNFIDFLIKCKINLDDSDQYDLKKAIIVNFEIKDKTCEKLIELGFSKKQIEYLGVKYENFTD